MPKPVTPLFNWLDQRDAGILLHPTSLPGTQGVGVLDGAVDDWFAFLSDASIRYWQVCPLGPTGYGDSPYQCFSTFAGNPYLIDLAALQKLGLLGQADLAPLAQLPQDHVDFGALYKTKWPILFKTFETFVATPDIALPYGDFEQFKQQHQFWLEPYTLFLAIKDLRHGQPWWEWPEELRFYSRARSAKLPESVQTCAQAHTFFQYLFFGQWQAVRERAQEKGISIIGDAPIFVAPDSADVWSQPELFQLDQKTGRPLCVAGVPPDYFAAEGQLWGNPLYAWEKHAETGFAWWLARLRANFLLCDVVRIDHFRAFDTYWSIPANAPTAQTGQWRHGPGLAFFEAIAQSIPDAKLIAEDLGELLPSVHTLRHATGLPGMAILQFAFGGNASNSYLPHNLHANSVIYPGTHDNDTTQGWYRSAPEAVRDHVRRYLHVSGHDIHWDFIRAAYASVCNLAVFPLQDLLGLDSAARFNVPGQAAGNWQWRYSAEQLSSLHHLSAAYLREQGVLFGRTGDRPASKTL
ncbi:MAG: malQ [Proteobacteria bacterium]|nr:malQ [Pseudomonadota bacterium]